MQDYNSLDSVFLLKIEMMEISPIKTEVFNTGDNLPDFIIRHIPRLKDKSILIVTSKIVALSQRAVVPFHTVTKRELVEREADQILCESYRTYLTIKDGILIAAAGIDESNAKDGYILWPHKPFEEARFLWKKLCSNYQIKNLGIIFSDSRSTPLRNGITGIGISWWGFKGLRNYIGRPDLFGRPLTMSTSNVVDSLSSAAVLVMGESNEQTPLAVVEGYEADFCDQVDPSEIVIDKKDDIFGPVLKL